MKGTQPPVESGCGRFTEEGDYILSFFVQRPSVRNGMNVNKFLYLAD